MPALAPMLGRCGPAPARLAQDKRISAVGNSSVAAVKAVPREVTLLDYGAGNVRSVRNALIKLGCVVKEVCFSA